MRGVAAPAEDGPDRPVPDAPRGPADTVGGDLGGLLGPAPAGQGRLLRLVELRWVAHRPGSGGRAPAWCVRLVSEQSLYNLAARTVELEVLPACQGYGVGVIPWSPLHGGLLGGILAKDAGSGDGAGGGRSGGGRAAELLEGKRDQVAEYEKFCASLGSPAGEVALAWLLHQPAVTAPIVGPRTMGQLDSAIRACALKLDEKSLARLDEVFPGPGGAAPEAYAW